MRPAYPFVSAAAIFFALASTSAGQVALPDVQFECVLLAVGPDGAIRIQRGVPYGEEVQQSYTVTVPYTEEVVLPGGQTKTIAKTREEMRTRTAMVTKMRPEECAYDRSDCRFVLTTGRRGRISPASGWTPAVLIQVADLKKPKLPRFFQKIFKPETMICLLREEAIEQENTDIYASDPPPAPNNGGGYGQAAQPAQVAGQVSLTVDNQSGRAIQVHYERDQSGAKETVLRRLGSGQSTRGFVTEPGVRWVATSGDRMVSEFWCPECATGESDLTWTIGPEYMVNTWRGDDGTRYAWKDSKTWVRYRPGGSLDCELEWVESTDEWICLYDTAKECYVRLYEDEAVVSNDEGWEQLMLSASAAKKGFKRNGANGASANPRVTISVPSSVPDIIARLRGARAGRSNKVPSDTGSDLTQAEAQAMLDVHNAARRQVGAPPLRWSKDIARYAQTWADMLAATNAFEHRPSAKYGENLAQGSSARQAAQLWLDEKSLYRGQRINGSNYLTFGHYTQMIWKSTTEFGCGKARSGGTTTWVANYNPAGNMQGERP